jgi:hypothetical protein
VFDQICSVAGEVGDVIVAAFGVAKMDEASCEV